MTESMEERWQAGDVVLAADGQLWRRASDDDLAQDLAWGDVIGYESLVPDGDPSRPLTLLVRNGKPCAGPLAACCFGDRWGADQGTLLVGHTDTCPMFPGGGFEEIALP